MQIQTHSPEETEAVGRKLAAQLQPGDVLAYYGDLGAGKTAFTPRRPRVFGVTEPGHQSHLHHRQRIPQRPSAAVPFRYVPPWLRRRAVRHRLGGLSRARRHLRRGVERRSLILSRSSNCCLKTSRPRWSNLPLRAALRNSKMRLQFCAQPFASTARKLPN